MKRILVIAGIAIVAVIAYTQFNAEPAVNPDPNHTHADFAVWINGEQLDFSAPELMSGLSTDEATHDEPHEALHPYYHLHDGVGHVIHRHKPGLPLKEFFDSLQVGFEEKCYVSFVPMADGKICSENALRLFVNGEEKPFDLSYPFVDLDSILITDAQDGPALEMQIQKLTDDACLYSRTCPERGDPPAESCIADPTVPCVEP